MFIYVLLSAAQLYDNFVDITGMNRSLLLQLPSPFLMTMTSLLIKLNTPNKSGMSCGINAFHVEEINSFGTQADLLSEFSVSRVHTLLLFIPLKWTLELFVVWNSLFPNDFEVSKFSVFLRFLKFSSPKSQGKKT